MRLFLPNLGQNYEPEAQERQHKNIIYYLYSYLLLTLYALFAYLS